MENQFQVIEKLLKGDHCVIHVNPLCPGVELPDHLKGSPTVTLKISYYFSGTLDVNEKEVVTELVFNGTPFTCVVPLEAIWGITSEFGVHTTWDDKAPNPLFPTLLKQSQKETAKSKPVKVETAAAEKKEGPKKARPDFLKRVK